ncbi:hypothetical protein Zmor_027114 [Zophobas morio]|uniref:Uncharacterized protein n=1 Tax=Zophobas morio TaxID=2755281 RepID=A0AA38HIM5_9CUCU|nr:hypothetical protein Zmor_027114 [Zophobas morio]
MARLLYETKYISHHYPRISIWFFFKKYTSFKLIPPTKLNTIDQVTIIKLRGLYLPPVTLNAKYSAWNSKSTNMDTQFPESLALLKNLAPIGPRNLLVFHRKGLATFSI